MNLLGRILLFCLCLFWAEFASSSPGVGQADQLTLRVGEVQDFDPLKNDTLHKGFSYTIEKLDIPDGIRVDILPDKKEVKIRTTSKPGPFKIIYHVQDEVGLKFQSEINVRVLPNAHPVAGPLELRLRTGETGTIDMLSASSDPDQGDLVNFDQIMPSSSSGVTVSGPVNNILTVQASEQTGQWDFEYQVSDKWGLNGGNILKIIVEPGQVNQPPEPINDEMTLDVGESKNVILTANDTDPDIDDVVSFIRFLKNPVGFTVVANGDNSHTVTAGNIPGTYKLPYRVRDIEGAGGTGRLIVTINKARPPENNPPEPKEDVYEVYVGDTRLVYPLKNDTDKDTDPLTISRLSSQSSKLITKRISGKSIAILARELGEYRAAYEVSDGQGGIASAEILVKAKPRPVENKPPQAVNDSFNMFVNERLVVNPLGNDKDEDGHDLSLVNIGTIPAGLSVTKMDGGLLEIRSIGGPETYEFEYTIQDIPGQLQASGLISVIVQNSEPLNSPPTALDDDYSVVAGQALVIAPQRNDTDVETETLRLSTPYNIDPDLQVEMGLGESYRVQAGTRAGRYVFDYSIIDDGGMADSAKVYITVTSKISESGGCRRSARLNEYLTQIDGMSKGLTTEFEEANPLVSELPGMELWPEIDRLKNRISQSPTCSADVKTRAWDIGILLARLRAKTSGVRPLEELRAEWLQINDDAYLAQPRVEKLRKDLPSCIPRSQYADYDNAIGVQMEDVFSLDLKRQELLKDLSFYLPENWDQEDFRDLGDEITALYQDIDSCPPEPLLITDNSYRLELGQTLRIDPLKDDGKPGDQLKITKIDPRQGVIKTMASYLVEPPFSISQLPNNQIEISAGSLPGNFEFEVFIKDQDGRQGSSVIGLDLVKPNTAALPWWIWPLGGGLLVGGGLLGFVLRGRPAPQPVTAKPPSQGARRLLRSHLRLRKDDGVPFAKSPLIASVTEPGPPPKEPIGHNIPLGLATISGPYGVLMEAYRATGRIGFAQEGVPTNDDVSLGTGFLIGRNLVMTNQHVYQAYKHYLEGDECGGIEFIAERDRDASDYYAFDGSPPIVLPELDIAIFRTAEKVKNRHPIKRVHIPTDDLAEREVIVVGYPCPFEVDDYILSLVEPDPIFAVKRVTQGQVFRHSTDKDAPFGILYKVDQMINPREELTAVCHNATTLPGNSGSPVLCAKTGKLVGVHFAGSRSLCGEEAANLAMAIEKILEKEEGEEF